MFLKMLYSWLVGKYVLIYRCNFIYRDQAQVLKVLSGGDFFGEIGILSLSEGQNRWGCVEMQNMGILKNEVQNKAEQSMQFVLTQSAMLRFDFLSITWISLFALWELLFFLSRSNSLSVPIYTTEWYAHCSYNDLWYLWVIRVFILVTMIFWLPIIECIAAPSICWILNGLMYMCYDLVRLSWPQISSVVFIFQILPQLTSVANATELLTTWHFTVLIYSGLR